VSDRCTAAEEVQERLPRRERARYRKALALLSSGGGVLALAGEGKMRLAGLGVYEALLTRSWSVRFSDPQEMCHLAEAAVHVAINLEPRRYGRRKVADLQARAWGELGNAYRAADRLKEAEEAFGEAFSLLKKGSGSKLLRARLRDFQVSLLGTLRNFKMALINFSVVPDLYREAGEPHLAGRALITKALYTHYNGKVHEAIQLNQEGLSLIDKSRDPVLVLTAVQNELLYLVEAGEFGRAKRVLFENRPRLTIGLGRISALKLLGVEGRISYGLKEYQSAERIFRDVKEGFAEVSLPFAGALATLDLALTLLCLERADEAEKEVLEATEIFFSLNINREILGAVILLEEIVRKREQSVSEFETVLRHIREKAITFNLG
jgi:tetratricopeptide (TPR) repeat protein